MQGIREIPENSCILKYDNRVNVRAAYDLSVVVPNYNRRELFRNFLRTLMGQKGDLSRIEMVVVDDGGKAAEVEIIRELAPPFRVRYFWQPHKGRRVGRVRNQGVRLALGSVILFLDSDALASPRLITSHLKAHAREKRLVVLGNVLDLKQGQSTVFRNYWGQDAPDESRWRFVYHWAKRVFLLPVLYNWRRLSKGLCLCTLHASARREDLVGVNGFDEIFDGRWGDEDLELGYRLEKAGAKIRWSASALVYHQWHPVGLDENVRDNRIRLFLKHPEVIRQSKIGGLANPFQACSLQQLADLERWEETQEQPSTLSAEPAQSSCRILFEHDPAPQASPLITLIVSTYNRESFYPAFLESLKEQSVDLRQVEVVFCDDGGRDNSMELVRLSGLSCKVKYLWQEKKGFRLASNRNNGLKVATAVIVAFTDIDAVLDRRFLETHLKQQNLRPRIISGIGYYLAPKRPFPKSVLPAYDLFRHRSIRFRLKCRVEKIRWQYLQALAAQNHYAIGTFVSALNCSMPKAWLKKGFDSRFDGIYGDEDIECFHRLAKAGHEVDFVPEALVFHRWHPTDKKKADADENRLYMLMKHPELLGHPVINVKMNRYYKKSMAEIRCFRLWTRRMSRLNISRGKTVRSREIKDRIMGLHRILIPAMMRVWRQPAKETAETGERRV